MNEKALHILEYDKILLRLEALAGSEGAKALCRDLRPMTDREAIEKALAETTDAAARLSAKGSLAFTGFADIRASVKRAESGSSLSITELLRVQKLLAMADRAKVYGKTDRDTPQDTLTERFEALEPADALRRELEADILSEEEIADNASPGLAKVRRELRTISDRIHNELNSLLLKNRDLLQDAVVTMRDGRYCLPVKAENKSQIAGIVHDQSGSGKALFIEPMSVVHLNNEWRELEIREQKEIEAVLADLSGKVVSWGGAVMEDYRLLTELDFIFAKARLSRSDKGLAPELDGGRLLELRRARHPLLDPKTVVPIDVKLGGDYDQLIITGPNTGGKTVTLKTVGLFTLMGQAGLLDGFFNDDYPRLLQTDYEALRKGHSLTHISPHLWKFFRLRPGSFPTVRISQFASLVCSSHNFFSHLLETTDVHDLVAGFTATAADYWHDHYLFDKQTSNSPKGVGAMLTESLVINAWLPLLYVYGSLHGQPELCNRAVEMLRQLKPESNNVITRWKACGIKARDAADSQALLQLHSLYCDQRRCLDCQIGYLMIRR